MYGARNIRTLFAIGLSLVACATAAQGQSLFVSVGNEKLAGPTSPHILRTRDVTLDPAAVLPLLADPTNKAAAIVLNLFPDTALAILPTAIESDGATTLRITATVPNIAGSVAALYLHNGILAGFVDTPAARYDIQPKGNGIHAIRQRAAYTPPPCTAVPPAQSLPPAKAVTAPKQTVAVTDILIVYTPAVRNALGGNAEAEAFAELAIDVTNLTYANSEVPHRVRLVGAAEVSYTESGIFQTDLDRITAPHDGFIDEVHSLRDAEGADIAVLLCNRGDLAGLAWILQDTTAAFDDYGFAVVHREFAVDYYVLAHEIGHVMGCAHERNPTTIDGVEPYGHAVVKNTFRTVMTSIANPDSIAYFSNPELLYDDQPLGVPRGQLNSADNARVLRATMPFTADFRTPPLYADPAQINVPHTSGAASFTVNVAATGTTNWTAQIETGGSWLTFLSNPSGINKGTVQLGYAPNTRSFSRSARVVITSAGALSAQTEVLIVQSPDCGFIGGPANVTATDGAYTDRVRISWDAIENADAYRIYRSRDGDIANAVAVSGWLGDTVLFDDFTAQAIIQPIPNCELGIVRSPRYTYWVKARNGCGESAYSAPDQGYVTVPAEATLFTPSTAAAALLFAALLVAARKIHRIV